MLMVAVLAGRLSAVLEAVVAALLAIQRPLPPWLAQVTALSRAMLLLDMLAWQPPLRPALLPTLREQTSVSLRTLLQMPDLKLFDPIGLQQMSTHIHRDCVINSTSTSTRTSTSTSNSNSMIDLCLYLINPGSV